MYQVREFTHLIHQNAHERGVDVASYRSEVTHMDARHNADVWTARPSTAPPRTLK
jgi:hypothetical protein